MVQPKYSPEEALERVKLMMKYDTSKTLNENKETISEQDYVAGTAIGTGAAAGAGAALGGAAASGLLGASTAAGAGAAGAGLYSAVGVGAALGPASIGVTAAAALGAGVIAGAAGLALTPLIIWYMDKDDAKPKVERMVQYCTSDAEKIQKIQRGLGDGEIRNLSDQLYDALEGVGTDEASVVGAFKSLKTVSDFCALVTRFNRDYGSEGDLLEWLDDDFDQTSEWMQIFRPLRDIVEDTLLSIKDEATEKDCTADPNQAKCKGGGGGGGGSTGGGGYKDCAGSYTKGCKAEAIKKVQGCLGLVADGKFGPKTEAALKAKGFSSFTDAEVDKICNKPTTPTVDSDEEDVDGQDANNV
jgi:hypothetical protein